jgi:hypothetical protein
MGTTARAFREVGTDSSLPKSFPCLCSQAAARELLISAPVRFISTQPMPLAFVRSPRTRIPHPLERRRPRHPRPERSEYEAEAIEQASMRWPLPLRQRFASARRCRTQRRWPYTTYRAIEPQ